MDTVPSVKRRKIDVPKNASSSPSKHSVDVVAEHHGNIHDIENDVRLLTMSETKSLYFEDVNLKGSVLVTKTVKKLKEWRQSDAGVATYNTVPPALTHYQDRLMKKGIDPLSDQEFLYRAVVYKILSEDFPDQTVEVFSYFTTFIINFPHVKTLLANKTMTKADSIAEQLAIIFPNASMTDRSLLVKVVQKTRKLPWNITGNNENSTPSEGVVTLARNFARARKVWDPEDPDLGRMLTRMGRISSNHGGAAAVKHRRKMYDLMRSTASPDEVQDIEEAISLTAQKVCTEKNPQCPSCPLKSLCNAYKDHLIIKNFVKLYLKSPSFLVYTPSRLCSEGNECLLCSPDAMTCGYTSSEGVRKYSMKTEDRVEKKHEAVCVIEDINSKSFYFSKVEKKKKNKLVRIQFSNEEKASSQNISEFIESELAKILPESTRDIRVKRVPKCDVVETIAVEKIAKVMYVYKIEVDGGNGAKNVERKEVWLKAGDVSPDTLSVRDWRVFQDCLFLSVDDQPPNAKAFQRRKYGLNDTERVQLSEEAHRKRYGTLTFSA